MLEVFHNNVSVCAQKVRVVLAEKDIPWTGRHLDLARGDQTDPAYLKIHPKGLVPAIVHDGRAVTDSTIICEYLDDAFPDPPLRPADPYARSVMRKWCKVPDDGIHIACGTLSFAAVFAKQLESRFGREAIEKRLAAMPDPARAGRQRQIMKDGFNVPFVRDAVAAHVRLLDDMAAELGDGRDWLAGDAFTLAEACLTPYIERLDRLGLAPMWDHMPAIAAWFERVRARPSYDAAFTAFPPSDYDDLLRDRGETVWPDVKKVLDAA